jgi:hypothetical protein
MLRIRTKIGDVFSVPLEGLGKKYFQYIANDLTQLNSDVIRAFVKTYPTDSSLDLREAVKGDVDFYAHVVIKWGIKMNLWQKVGNVSYSERLDVLLYPAGTTGSELKPPMTGAFGESMKSLKTSGNLRVTTEMLKSE